MANNETTLGLDDPASILEMRKRHLSLGLRLQALAVAALDEWEQKLKSGEPLNVPAADAKALLDCGMELERGALPATSAKRKKPN